MDIAKITMRIHGKRIEVLYVATIRPLVGRIIMSELTGDIGRHFSRRLAEHRRFLNDCKTGLSKQPEVIDVPKAIHILRPAIEWPPLPIVVF
jgi:hypothetical protein